MFEKKEQIASIVNEPLNSYQPWKYGNALPLSWHKIRVEQKSLCHAVPKPGSGIRIPCIKEHLRWYLYTDTKYAYAMSRHSFIRIWILNSSQLYIYIYTKEQTSLNENSVTNFRDFCERYEQNFFTVKCIRFYSSFLNN